MEQVERLSVEEYTNTELFRQLVLEKEQLDAAKEQFAVYKQEQLFALDVKELSLTDREMVLCMAGFMLQYRIGDKNMYEAFLEEEPKFRKAREFAVQSCQQ